MSGSSQTHARRVLKAGGPPALITAGFGVGATGILGNGIESKVDPIATGAAGVIGLSPEFGPALLMLLGVIVMVVAVFVPGLFEDYHP
ncbi:MAG: hypothetical protein ABEJ35_01480 [Halobacteriaceae archaeon]